MNHPAFRIILLMVPLLISGCEEAPRTDEGPAPTNNVNVPESRPFYMGFTPWPYDFTQKAVDDTYCTVLQHSDLIAHHFDGGVPWEEALAGKPYHPHVIQEIENRVKESKGKKVYVAVTPLGFDRKSLALYWGRQSNMESGRWNRKKFSDFEVITAYTNFCRYMIDAFDPDYMAYGIEVDAALPEGRTFEEFRVLVETVYTTLKKENPDLPLFLTFQVTSSHDKEAKQRIDEQLLMYSDYVAVSAYPFWMFGESVAEKADPRNIPRDLFSSMAELAPEKPFAVAETGYIAEDLIIKSLSITIEGSEKGQADYVQWLLEECTTLHAEFVVWFVSRDYDQAWETLEEMGADEFLKTWRDTGFLDGKGNYRLALQVWDAWLQLPRS